MSAPTNSDTTPRIPPPVNGIQVNFCKNPTCANFGVPASVEKQRRGPGAKGCNRDNCTVKGAGYSEGRAGTPIIYCEWCKETPPLKSNQGICEEVERVSAYLRTPEPSCPNPTCVNHGVGIDQPKGHYHGKGKTKAGASRFLCVACANSFSVNTSKPAKTTTFRTKTPRFTTCWSTPCRCAVSNTCPPLASRRLPASDSD